jgi:hypothetical protein
MANVRLLEGVVEVAASEAIELDTDVVRLERPGTSGERRAMAAVTSPSGLATLSLNGEGQYPGGVVLEGSPAAGVGGIRIVGGPLDLQGHYVRFAIGSCEFLCYTKGEVPGQEVPGFLPPQELSLRSEIIKLRYHRAVLAAAYDQLAILTSNCVGLLSQMEASIGKP